MPWSLQFPITRFGRTSLLHESSRWKVKINTLECKTTDGIDKKQDKLCLIQRGLHLQDIDKSLCIIVDQPDRTPFPPGSSTFPAVIVSSNTSLSVEPGR